MKVIKVHIKDFHQFKDLEIDLTYPMGHENERQPLKKVCIIGQSGTGKTKLLELIGGLTHNENNIREKYSFSPSNGSVEIKNFDLSYEQKLLEDDGYYLYNIYLKGKELPIGFDIDEFTKMESAHHAKAKPSLLYYPAELRFELGTEVGNIDFKSMRVIDFSIEKATSIWNVILKDVQKYQEDELRIRQEISRVVEDKANDLEAIQKALKPLADLQKNNFNPIVDVAEKCLNPILKRFRLRVRTKLEINKKDDIGFIKIEDFEGNEIPYGLWSTGTKQIILSALPMYLLKPKHSIILFDEPERSLYPDLQREIIDYYVSLTNDSQLFFSTHSPIIAASFEPWEIVELIYHDGSVIQKKYYEGERHVDNYTVSPNYLTYDLILSKVFGLKETYPEIRDEKITEILMLRNQLGILKAENKLKTKDGQLLTERYLKLAKLLAWDFKIPTDEEA